MANELNFIDKEEAEKIIEPEKELVHTLVCKPAKKGQDYHFHIPRKLIRHMIIDPNVMYELRIYKIKNDKKES